MIWLFAISVVIAAVSALATGALVGPLRRRAILDRPNARSSHARPTPRGGGLAVVPIALAAWVAGAGFDWGGDRPPNTPWHDTVVYELHVKGFTRLHPGVPEGLRGTYAGLASDAAIGHLLDLVFPETGVGRRGVGGAAPLVPAAGPAAGSDGVSALAPARRRAHLDGGGAGAEEEEGEDHRHSLPPRPASGPPHRTGPAAPRH